MPSQRTPHPRSALSRDDCSITDYEACTNQSRADQIREETQESSAENSLHDGLGVPEPIVGWIDEPLPPLMRANDEQHTGAENGRKNKYGNRTSHLRPLSGTDVSAGGANPGRPQIDGGGGFGRNRS